MKAIVNNTILCRLGHEMVHFMHLQVVSEYFTLVRLLPIHSKGTVAIFCIVQYLEFHLLLFITRKYTIINANLKLINAKIHSFYPTEIHQRKYATICIKGHSIAPTGDH